MLPYFTALCTFCSVLALLVCFYLLISDSTKMRMMLKKIFVSSNFSDLLYSVLQIEFLIKYRQNFIVFY